MTDKPDTQTDQASAAVPIFAVVTLDTPIRRGEQTIGIVKLRKPRSGELRGLSMVDLVKLEVDALKRLLPRISEPHLTEADVDALDPSDLFQMASEVAGFLLPKGMQPDSLAS